MTFNQADIILVILMFLSDLINYQSALTENLTDVKKK
jgi:hypothetical protein